MRKRPRRPADGFIGGVVTSSRGPEAGVWVIAETTELKTPFIKIVVTDEAGRYVLPQLPEATYNVWVRGYGLADSDKVEGRPGDTALNLTAKIASSPAEAAGRMGLARVTIHPQRIEQATLPPLAAVTARALAPLDVLLGFAARDSSPPAASPSSRRAAAPSRS